MFACAAVFKRKDHMKVHVKSQHENLKYPCHICPKSFSRKNNHNNHMKNAHINIPRENVIHYAPPAIAPPQIAIVPI